MLCTKIDNDLYVIGDDFDEVYFGSWEKDPRRKCEVIYNEHLQLIDVHPITLEQKEYINDGDSWYNPTTSKKLAYWNYNGMSDGYASTPHYVALYPIKEYFEDIIKEHKRDIEHAPGKPGVILFSFFACPDTRNHALKQLQGYFIISLRLARLSSSLATL